jgi:hypothetical protein
MTSPFGYLDAPPEFSIKQGDTEPPLTIRCEDANGKVQPVPEGATVQFFLRDPGDPDGPLLVEGPAAVLDAAGGIVSYVWDPDDTELEPGTYEGEFEVKSGPRRATYPNDGYIPVHITADLGDQ